METLGYPLTHWPQVVPRRTAFITAMVLVVLYLVISMRRPGRVKRLGVFLVFSTLMVSQVAIMFSAVFPWYPSNLEKLRLMTVADVDNSRRFSKSRLMGKHIENFEEFANVCRLNYLSDREYLQSKWKMFDPQLLEAAYYMNVVSHLWGYGNRLRVDRPGCVGGNAEGADVGQTELTIADYLNSDIGCCVDYAVILKVLLDAMKIRNRTVAARGHVFNEMAIGRNWYTLDANLNMLFFGDWDGIQNRDNGTGVSVFVFGHSNLIPNSRFYREVIGQFRLHWLLRVLSRTAPVVAYNAYAIPRD